MENNQYDSQNYQAGDPMMANQQISQPQYAQPQCGQPQYNQNQYRTQNNQIVHDLYKSKDIQKSLKKIIPDLKIANEDVDRKWLKTYLIENHKKKKQLERFVHKEVVSYIEKELKKAKQPVVIEAAFLFESGLDLLCDKTIYVTASRAKQIEHLEARGDDVEKALKLNANFDGNNKKKATHIIINDKDVANLEKQVSAICGK